MQIMCAVVGCGEVRDAEAGAEVIEHQDSHSDDEFPSIDFGGIEVERIAWNFI